VCFVVHKTTSELEHVILTTLYFVATKNTDSWCVRKEDLQHAPSSTMSWTRSAEVCRASSSTSASRRAACSTPSHMTASSHRSTRWAQLDGGLRIRSQTLVLGL
jgi:hypothetical protein